MRKQFVVKNRHGLHLRPATEFVKLTSNYNGEIILKKDDVEVNAKSILGILSLGIEFGTKIIIELIDKDDEKFMDQLKAFFDKKE